MFIILTLCHCLHNFRFNVEELLETTTTKMSAQIMLYVKHYHIKVLCQIKIFPLQHMSDFKELDSWLSFQQDPKLFMWCRNRSRVSTSAMTPTAMFRQFSMNNIFWTGLCKLKNTPQSLVFLLWNIWVCLLSESEMTCKLGIHKSG